MTTAQAQSAAIAQVVRAVADTIRELGEAPAGHVYSELMAYGCTLEQFNGIIGILIRAKLVARDDSHLLRWIGPKS